MKLGDRWLRSKIVATFFIKKDSAVSSGLHFLTESYVPINKCLIIKKISILIFFKFPVWSSSVQFSRSVVSDSLWPHGLQHAKASLPITNSQSLLKCISVEYLVQGTLFIVCLILSLITLNYIIRIFEDHLLSFTLSFICQLYRILLRTQISLKFCDNILVLRNGRKDI